MIGDHLSISALRWARSASGVARFSTTGSVPKFTEALDHDFIFERRLQRLSEHIDDRFRRALGRVKSMPYRNLEAFQPGLHRSSELLAATSAVSA